MRQVIISLCIFTAACSQAEGPTAPIALSGPAGAQVQATDSTPVDVTFTKWIDPNAGYPSFVGVAGGDVPGEFAATVLERTAFDNGTIVHLRARYEVVADNAARSFVAEIEGNQNNQTGSAVLTGSVVDGWLTGARVQVTFDVIQPCPAFNQNLCFTGILRVLAGSSR
jgi:hypothetical protein